jgi:hypothetical protein
MNTGPSIIANAWLVVDTDNGGGYAGGRQRGIGYMRNLYTFLSILL